MRQSKLSLPVLGGLAIGFMVLLAGGSVWLANSAFTDHVIAQVARASAIPAPPAAMPAPPPASSSAPASISAPAPVSASAPAPPVQAGKAATKKKVVKQLVKRKAGAPLRAKSVRGKAQLERCKALGKAAAAKCRARLRAR